MTRFSFAAGLAALLGLMFWSLFVGVSPMTMTQLWSDAEMRDVFFISRVPRTLALLLAGSAVSVAGLIMQMLTQNRFAEPSIAGTTQSASLGLLLVMIINPAAPVMVKMVVATLFAFLGTGLFLLLLQRMCIKTPLMVPLTGIMLGAIFSAVSTFLAMEFDLLQSLGSWESGDFSGVLRGRYELLWFTGLLTLLACIIADRFTVAGMGREFAVNMGLNYRRVVFIGMTIIALISGVVIVVVGVLPFLGLIVPNLVSMAMGDNLRRTIPWVALCGGGLVVLCDIIGRLINFPWEIPVSVTLGCLGAAIFLLLIIRSQRNAG